MKIALIGYGKMGKMIEQIARKRGHEIVSIIDVDNRDDIHSDAFRSADVAIEFTQPTAALQNVTDTMNEGVKVVSGTTGWFDAHNDEIQRLCNEEGKTLFWASNFSVGVAIFAAVNRYLAHIMNNYPDYSIRLEETHHIHKLDKPSGTALTLAKAITDEVERTNGTLPKIESFREGEVPGVHTVIYDSPADSIRITHEAHSREGLALGAVLAAEYTHEHEGLLTIDDLFNF